MCVDCKQTVMWINDTHEEIINTLLEQFMFMQSATIRVFKHEGHKMRIKGV